MKKEIIRLLIFFISLAACKNKPSKELTITPRSTVTVTTIKTGIMLQTDQLSATAQYLRRNTVSAPIAGYINYVNNNFNDYVTKGQLLYIIETKERFVLGNSINNEIKDKNYGLIKIYAPMSGVIVAIPQSQTGVFVTEGSVLCNIADTRSLYFQVNIPYEYEKYIKDNTICTLHLPDNTLITAHLEKPIIQANTGLQTIPYMAKPLSEKYIPENIIASVQLVTYKNNAANMLPKNAVLSDELMKHFWIMKLINDSIAVKVPITIGAQNDSMIEIKQPHFSKDDRILLSGNYGLSDTALVKIL
jgi:biotin carboxyl carrier protein